MRRPDRGRERWPFSHRKPHARIIEERPQRAAQRRLGMGDASGQIAGGDGDVIELKQDTSLDGI